jgi:hypothetical protein
MKPVPDQPPIVEFVAKDAGAAKRMSSDGCIAPGRTFRARHLLRIKGLGDVYRARPTGEHQKNPPDN